MASLPIRQQLNRLTGLRAEPKALLIEVCELIENGGRGLCWATNTALAGRMGKPAKSISRLLTGLEHGGWLLVEHLPEQGNRRQIRPTTKCRAVYDPSVTSEDTPPPEKYEVRIPTLESEDTHLAEMRISKSEDTPPLEVRIPTPKSEDRVSPEVRRLDYDQATTSEEKKGGEEERESEDTPPTSFLLEKISQLEAKLAAARKWAEEKKAHIKKLEKQLADLATTPTAAPPDSRIYRADAAPIFKESAKFFEYVRSLKSYDDVDMGHYLITIQQSAEDSFPTERTNNKWKKYISTFLENLLREGKLVKRPPKPGDRQPTNLLRPKMEIFR